ncbi:MAG TPA: 16S rRNA (adenine(1518)-N(6)/adenine(1519)-N(6))-dimethyltransferase RsmA [Thermoflexales bacterium]|jgi:16S rRNA (adenine1518-N6/adenine1519-N6)-dimethyltransferase|nr:16S rRNA (adenine(1518)-N(6)/adenine(1519)-N(6))-dimethyltransferase RsmA [Thermoflexales bacterium]HQX09392.1 16S rRNA (adenine(1518)-N(6)/adenine(1519)-N(6))-dimethyltransferase RsmA [Thermoflexales bacterium]HQY25347.1 16S rRNA (adenine(1518)-N(6)/adenine(1519)-N(6))-dimethyltransferase RsmA [Thermoflexales bacterium]HQZ53992.1 16S rRNA (adenine(1518)-N(6)/adenine(1519)-N(6))-dimethyltransferase RsmA [Thermoflexales bacterium]HRA53154.1 16S rRNA (adenine(1518)-N(6)/adenine(1519)-N(6))-dim
MEIVSRNQLQNLGIEPKKSLGQNFLVDAAAAERIVDAVGIEANDLVFEIGPGTGALTRALVKQAGQVIAIELDPRLVETLREIFKRAPNLTVVHTDALEADYAALAAAHAPTNTGIRFVGNLPYYITSAIVRKILESGLAWKSVVVTVQLEVAQRMVAGPGDMGLLSVATQLYSKAEMLMRLAAGAFYPQPGIDSAVVRLTPHPAPLFDQPEILFKLARAGFSQRRKQLINTLSTGVGLSKIDAAELLLKAKVEPSRRPETLTVAEWIRLSQVYLAFTPSEGAG